MSSLASSDGMNRFVNRLIMVDGQNRFIRQPRRRKKTRDANSQIGLNVCNSSRWLTRPGISMKVKTHRVKTFFLCWQVVSLPVSRVTSALLGCCIFYAASIRGLYVITPTEKESFHHREVNILSSCCLFKYIAIYIIIVKETRKTSFLPQCIAFHENRQKIPCSQTSYKC